MIKYTPKFIQYIQKNGKNFTSKQRKLISEKEIKKYVKNYIKNHTYFSQRNVSLDFIRDILKYQDRISSRSLDKCFMQLSKKIQSYISRAILPALINEGILTKFNTRNYKIIENLDVSLIEV